MISIVSIMAVAMPIVMLILIILILTIGFSPKMRAKLLGRQVKTMKYVMDENEEDLRYLSNKKAEIGKEGVEITASAVKEGLKGNTKYCKYCGAKIDSDSKFCKECGKEQ